MAGSEHHWRRTPTRLLIHGRATRPPGPHGGLPEGSGPNASCTLLASLVDVCKDPGTVEVFPAYLARTHPSDVELEPHVLVQYP